MKLNLKMRSLKKVLMVLIAVIGLNQSARAIPTLQLDIDLGNYVKGTDETIYSPGNPFTLFALYNGTLSDSKKFYISAAIVPNPYSGGDPLHDVDGEPHNDFGFFTINGQTYSANSLMAYGGPPVDSQFDNLPTHGIFNTWYAEINFSFNPNAKAISYNSAEHPGGVTPFNSGSFLYYNAFDVDITGLKAGYSVHFDLYDEVIQEKRNGLLDYSTHFAPFSHDAQSLTSENPPENPVPDGGMTLISLSMGILALFGSRKKLA